MNKINGWISEGSGWTVVSADNHYINVIKYVPLKGSKEVSNGTKGLINCNVCVTFCVTFKSRAITSLARYDGLYKES